MTDPPCSFREFIELVLAGDPSATEQLFKKYRHLVRILAVGMLQKKVLVRVDESDIAQETMQKAVADLNQFQGQTEAQFVDWLKTILSRTAQNCVRFQKAQKRDVDRTINESYSSAIVFAETCRAASSNCPQNRASQNELILRLSWAIEELSKNERRAVELQHFQMMKIDDIAIEMDKSPVAVAGLLYRGIKKLKKLMVNE
ncbi:RNA polymerase sigma factor RpoE [Symmachiella macrocystis]|uniref:RNA polymerase sigma factor RpoE n=1 Tax=Symmachiella macrocystis TaxID=2527985 RepID=A0A5C6AYT4_9PLAN|nr:sigma-70 family RNA polymerase sigma factor [Symmachiella macrocystis]TWU05143.1 RNA polymerase sigma factor RpoE [Symmachiella macrocystis]